MEKKYLLRTEAAEYLTSQGLPITKNMLQKLACQGRGPLYQQFGNRTVYTRENLEAWAEERLSVPRRSTSEAA